MLGSPQGSGSHDLLGLITPADQLKRAVVISSRGARVNDVVVTTCFQYGWDGRWLYTHRRPNQLKRFMERNLLAENSDNCVISKGIMNDNVEPLHRMKKGLMRKQKLGKCINFWPLTAVPIL